MDRGNDVIPVECRSCREEPLCPAAPEMFRVSALAWADGRSAPDCPFYEPRFCRGVEGVLDVRRGARV